MVGWLQLCSGGGCVWLRVMCEEGVVCVLCCHCSVTTAPAVVCVRARCLWMQPGSSSLCSSLVFLSLSLLSRFSTKPPCARSFACFLLLLLCACFAVVSGQGCESLRMCIVCMCPLLPRHFVAPGTFVTSSFVVVCVWGPTQVILGSWFHMCALSNQPTNTQPNFFCSTFKCFGRTRARTSPGRDGTGLLRVKEAQHRVSTNTRRRAQARMYKVAQWLDGAGWLDDTSGGLQVSMGAIAVSTA